VCSSLVTLSLPTFLLQLILELCKADGPPDLVRIQANLEKIHACSAQLGSLNQEVEPLNPLTPKPPNP
jgi:hypothetical protein